MSPVAIAAAAFACSSFAADKIRVGFISTFSITMSDPGTTNAATSAKAAEEGSPGTAMVRPVSLPWPSMKMWRTPCSSVSTERLAPKPFSIFSVWSRVITGSMTVVMPGALRPASSTADFTWALGTGRS